MGREVSPQTEAVRQLMPILPDDDDECTRSQAAQSAQSCDFKTTKGQRAAACKLGCVPVTPGLRTYAGYVAPETPGLRTYAGYVAPESPGHIPPLLRLGPGLG